MLVTLCGTVMLVMLIHARNALFPIVVTRLGISNAFTLAQSKKAFSLIVVTVLGSVSDSRLTQLQKASFSIVVTPSGIAYFSICFPAGKQISVFLSLVNSIPPSLMKYIFEDSTSMFSRFLHEVKTLLPIVVTLGGMTTLRSSEFEPKPTSILKALSQITVVRSFTRYSRKSAGALSSLLPSLLYKTPLSSLTPFSKSSLVTSVELLPSYNADVFVFGNVDVKFSAFAVLQNTANRSSNSLPHRVCLILLIIAK